MDYKYRQLLRKFLAGHCTDEELVQVQALLEQQEAQDILDEMMQDQTAEEWHNPPEADEAMQKRISLRQAEMRERIAATEKQHGLPAGDTKHPTILMKFMRYAAVWAGILLTASLAFWQLKKTTFKDKAITYIEKINKQGIPVRYVLPDSSTVYLAAASSLKYPERFTGTERTIQLQGEAFFDVTSDAEKPFIIHTGDVQTRVLGTSFKVSAFAGEPLEVAVVTGKVGVSVHTGNERKELAVLTPGLKVTWNSKTSKTSKGFTDIAGLTQWKTGELIFKEHRIGRVALELERRYGIKLRFEDEETKNYQVSGTFSPEEPITSVLDMLAFVGKFKYRHSMNSNTFTIYKSK